MRMYRGLICIVLFFLACKEEQPEPKELVATTPSEIEINEAYGFNLDDYEVLRDTIRYGDSFGELMLKNHADYPKILKITEDYRDTFDVRKIRVGKPYVILKTRDTLPKAAVFIYENDRINYTVVDLRDSAVAYKDQKKVKYHYREVSGVIKTSLSDAILEQGVDYYITHELSDIYAWTIDFFRLQKGDRFKAIFREKYINDTLYAGSEPIEAAYFEHEGQPLYAFAYESDSLKNIIDYFDEEANNLRRTFLRAPVKFSRISSRYNLKRRIRYYGYRIRPHKGTDYAAPVGTPIMATADGVVTESTRRRGNGRYVKIRHNGTYSTQYLHMRKQNVRRGDIVKQGDVIGWIGMTGNTAGPHVCYRFWKNGRQVDPLREELPAAEPLAEPLRPKYFDFIEPLKFQLDCIPFPELKEEQKDELLTLNQ